MEIEELQKLKDKIEIAKSEKAKAEGAIEQIEKQWEEEFECDSPEAVKQKITGTENQIKSLTEKRDNYVLEIETAMENV